MQYLFGGFGFFALGDARRASSLRGENPMEKPAEGTLMIVQAKQEIAKFADSILTPRLQTVLGQLATAREYAICIHADVWDFAVELGGLLNAGAMVADLRWLLAQGYIDLATEITQPGDPVRSFHAVRCLVFTARTCFVLSDEGTRWMDAGAARDVRGVRPGPCRLLCERFVGEGDACESELPCWDAAEKVLCLAGRVVKRYCCSSPNQEAVLAAFEEEQWPRRIEDPLRPVEGMDSKRRLRDTIGTLNTKQENRLIRFRAVGTGEHVMWEPFHPLSSS
jgi:hypothetical protein